MVEIASQSARPTSGALGDIHRTAIDIDIDIEKIMH